MKEWDRRSCDRPRGSEDTALCPSHSPMQTHKQTDGDGYSSLYKGWLTD